MTNWDENQFVKIASLLDAQNLNYWIESGTLLGLYRNGELINHDKDIDIGVWSDQENLICDFALKLSSEYDLKKYYYKDRLNKIKLLPINNESLRKIDVNLYFQHEDMAYCFTSVFFKKHSMHLFKNLIYYAMLLIEYTFTERFIRKNKIVFFGKWPLKYLRRPGFWAVKAKHFLVRDNILYRGIKINIPSEPDIYLQNKYGDWREEKKNWYYMSDDGCLQRDFTPELLNRV